MRSELVISSEVSLQAGLGIAHAVVGVQIDFLIFDALPQTLHEHVIPPATFAVHADLDAVAFQQSREIEAGELAALVGVEDFRPAVAVERLLNRLRYRSRWSTCLRYAMPAYWKMCSAKMIVRQTEWSSSGSFL
jgi:hypothetical protein